MGLVIHGKRKKWRREEAWVGWESEGKKGRLCHLMEMGGNGEPQSQIRRGKVRSRWARDCRLSGDMIGAFYLFSTGGS